jgi:hypothetical protein
MNRYLKFIVIGLCIAGSISCRPRRSNSDSDLSEVPKSDCSISTRCSNAIAKDWHQFALDVDLMREYVASIGLGNNVSANVAVIDSGYDRKSDKLFDVPRPIEAKRGVNPTDKDPFNDFSKFKPDEIGDPAIDEGGHGTAVASMISGKQTGNSQGVNLSVYRVIPKGNKGSTSNTILRMSQYNACLDNQDPDGVAVINVSWGGRLDESQIEVDENSDKEFLAAMSAKGCLIVKSAGNDNFRRNRPDNPDDPLLRVAAVDTSGELSWFSTVGEIAAPGSDTLVITSQTLQRDRDDKRIPRVCDNTPHHRFVNGTSFASPISAGIAGQIVRVLKYRQGFSGIAPGDRIRLINRILTASMAFGSINGLRAVTIADRYAALTAEQKSNLLASKDAVPFQQLLASSPDPICGLSLPNCESSRTCDDRRSCIKQARRMATMCTNLDPAAMYKASMTAFKMGDFEIGHRLAKSSLEMQDPQKKSRLLREALNQYLALIGFQLNLMYDPKDRESVMERQKESIRGMNANFLRMVVLPYLAVNSGKGSWGSTQFGPFLMDGMIFSRSIQEALSLGVDAETGEHRGGGPVADAVAESLSHLSQLMGERRFMKYFDQIVDEQLEQSLQNYKQWENTSLSVTDNSSPMARVMDLLLARLPPNSRIMPDLIAAEKKLLNGIRGMNEVYRNTTEKLPIFYEAYPTRSIMKGIVSRHGFTLEELKVPEQLSKAAPVEVLIRLGEKIDNPNDLYQLSVAWASLRQISIGQGWGSENDHEIAELALQRINEMWTQISVERQTEVINSIESIVIQATNLDFLAELSDGFWNNQAFGVSFFDTIAVDDIGDKARAEGRSYRRSPVLTSRIMKLIGIKILAALDGVSRKNLVPLRTRGEILEGIGIAWRGLTYDDVIEVTSISTPALAENALTRLSKAQAPAKQFTIPQTPLVDQFMSKLLQLSRRSKNTQSTLSSYSDSSEDRAETSAVSALLDGAFDLYDPRDPASFPPSEVFKKLPPSGEWKKSVEAIRSINQYPDTGKANSFLNAVNSAKPR